MQADLDPVVPRIQDRVALDRGIARLVGVDPVVACVVEEAIPDETTRTLEADLVDAVDEAVVEDVHPAGAVDELLAAVPERQALNGGGGSNAALEREDGVATVDDRLLMSFGSLVLM